MNTVKSSRIRLEKAYAEIREVVKIIATPRPGNKTIKETVYAKESTISGLRSETDAMRQECALLEELCASGKEQQTENTTVEKYEESIE